MFYQVQCLYIYIYTHSQAGLWLVCRSCLSLRDLKIIVHIEHFKNTSKTILFKSFRILHSESCQVRQFWWVVHVSSVPTNSQLRAYLRSSSFKKLKHVQPKQTFRRERERERERGVKSKRFTIRLA